MTTTAAPPLATLSAPKPAKRALTHLDSEGVEQNTRPPLGRIDLSQNDGLAVNQVTIRQGDPPGHGGTCVLIGPCGTTRPELRSSIKRLLASHKYPTDKQPEPSSSV